MSSTVYLFSLSFERVRRHQGETSSWTAIEDTCASRQVASSVGRFRTLLILDHVLRRVDCTLSVLGPVHSRCERRSVAEIYAIELSIVRVNRPLSLGSQRVRCAALTR